MDTDFALLWTSGGLFYSAGENIGVAELYERKGYHPQRPYPVRATYAESPD
jgi:hypothetical protein